VVQKREEIRNRRLGEYNISSENIESSTWYYADEIVSSYNRDVDELFSYLNKTGTYSDLQKSLTGFSFLNLTLAFTCFRSLAAVRDALILPVADLILLLDTNHGPTGVRR
jgi:hypothetical protein